MTMYIRRNYFVLYSLVIVCSIIISQVATEATVLAPVGNSCHQDSDCFDDLSCVFDKCKCKPRYVQSGKYCFKEAYYGQICWFDEQCIDHRQICTKTTEGPRRCACDMYHEYNDTISQCFPKANLTSLLQEKYNTFDDISGNAKVTFNGILIVGLIVSGIGMFCCVAASVYCCRIYTSDRKLEKDVNALVVKNGGKPSSFAVKKRESERRRQLSEAAPISPVIDTSLMLA